MSQRDEPQDYDPLDEALTETFPASDPIAVSEPSSWPRPREPEGAQP